MAWNATGDWFRRCADSPYAYGPLVPRPPREWLASELKDFGTRRPVKWKPADSVHDRGDRAAAQEQFDICALVRELMDRRRITKKSVAAALGISVTQFNQIMRGESRLGSGHRCALGIHLDFPASLELNIDEHLRTPPAT